MQSRFFQISPEQMTDTLPGKPGEPSIVAKQRALQDCLDDETSVVLVPHYPGGQLCQFLINKYGAGFMAQARDFPSNGDVPTGPSAMLITVNPSTHFIFILYEHLWDESKRDLMPLMRDVNAILVKNPGFTTLVIPPFGTNNGYSFIDCANLLLTNLQASFDEGLFKTVGGVEVVAEERFPTMRVIHHLQFLFHTARFTDYPVCGICMHAVGTSFFQTCGHAGMCDSCISYNTLKTGEMHACPYCKERSNVHRIPAKKETGSRDETRYVPFPCQCHVASTPLTEICTSCDTPIEKTIKLFFVS